MATVEGSSRSISPRWKYAIIGGVVSIPFMTANYWQSGSEVSLSPVLFAGVLAGYLAKRRVDAVRGVGARAGLIGSIPGVWMLIDVLPSILGMSQPEWFTVVSVVVAFVVTVIIFGLAALVGEIGGRVGGWLSNRGNQANPAQAVN